MGIEVDSEVTAAGMRELLCPRCKEGRFPYAEAEKTTSGMESVKKRVCPCCGLERIDVHIIEYRESAPIPEAPYPGEGGMAACQ